MSMEYNNTGDYWCLIKIQQGKSKPIHKVALCWDGDHPQGGGWQLSSGFSTGSEIDLLYNKDGAAFYAVKNLSGSVYFCQRYENRYGVNHYFKTKRDEIVKNGHTLTSGYRISLLDYQEALDFLDSNVTYIGHEFLGRQRC